MATSMEWWARTRATGETSAPRGSVCIAAADESERETISAAVRALGFRTHETNTAGAAIFIASQIHLQAVVINLVLEDGWSLKRLARIREAAPDALLLALLPERLAAGSALAELAYRAGADATLAAPVSAAAICAAFAAPRPAVAHSACLNPAL